MIAMYDAIHDRLTVRGHHKGSTPRIWRVDVRIDSDDGPSTLTFAPRSKILLSELVDTVHEHIKTEYAVRLNAAISGWTAYAR